MANKYLGTLQSTGTAVTNASTGTPFVIPKGAKILVQADAAGYFLGDASTVSSSTGVKIAADGTYTMSCGRITTTSVSSATSSIVSWISGSGTTNLKVFELIPDRVA